MANLTGINLPSGIVPFTTEDLFPTHYSEYGKGGWREVENIAARDAISIPRRKIGMAVYVEETNTCYVLRGGITNEYWTTFGGNSDSSEVKITTYVFTQAEANTRWDIGHNLDRYPSVTVVDSAGTTVMGDVQYIDKNNIVVKFSSPFAGKVYLN